LGLDQVLADRGYVFGSPTAVMTARVDDVVRVLAGVAVEVADSASEDWLRLWWAVDGRGDDTALAIARSILAGGPALYGTVRDSSGVAAVGRVALVRDWGGVYCMAVRADARRRGFGSGLLAGLLAAARSRGVRRTWLQVRADNPGARRLYRRAGYTEVARYHYRSHGRQEPVQHVHTEP
jgi:ribosomal protein S18 acetylase RimI-like enzyme